MTSQESRQTVLVVDDNPDNIRILGKILGGLRLRFATSGEEALEMAFLEPPDLILLDVMMPGMDGFTVCSKLKEDIRTRNVPIIIVTVMNDFTSEALGFAAGAVDFLSKPVNPPTVRARVNAHLILKRQRDDLITANGRLQQEIKVREQLEEKLREQAEFDHLTGLPNRLLFRDRLKQSVQLCSRSKKSFALMFIDLDRFKWVNDNLGHDAGDELLVGVARRLESVLRRSDTVARLGGDEFTVILNEVSHNTSVKLVAGKILEQLAAPFRLKDKDVEISGSVGIALFPDDGADAETLGKHADIAMYQAKESGRNRFQFFSHDISQLVTRRMEMERELHLAIKNNEFFLDYQPRIKTSLGSVTGMEALVRWDHPTMGILFPKDFLSIAEGNGLITQLGAWVMGTALRDAVLWRNQGFLGLKLAVNLSAIQFRDSAQLLAMVREHLRETGFPPQDLELEITESMMMGNPDHATATLDQLRAMGITITMDDFGTGYSSFALLKNLPIQSIKIDRTFLSDLTDGSENSAFLAAILAMAKQLGLHVVVEGVEDLEQLRIMKVHGGDEVQGYLFSPPLCGIAFLELLHGRLPMGGNMIACFDS
ncbi:MAG: EAL domain-containing protein [Nitrospirae bacterium]|nr:EAL domain-containing protein [Magnetococcales bacterium]